MVISTSDKVNKSIRQSRLESMRKRRMLLRSQKRNQNKTGYQKRTTTRTDSFKKRSTVRTAGRPIGEKPRRSTMRTRYGHRYGGNRPQDRYANEHTAHAQPPQPPYATRSFGTVTPRTKTISQQYNSNPALQGTGVIDRNQVNWWSNKLFLDRF